jgi:hypothetical protein
MGKNGQQLYVSLPSRAGKVKISGPNQTGKTEQWDGVAGPLFDIVGQAISPEQAGWGVRTEGWWWKDKVQIWYDSEGKTHAMTVDVPVSQPLDWFPVAAPGVPLPEGRGLGGAGKRQT